MCDLNLTEISFHTVYTSYSHEIEHCSTSLTSSSVSQEPRVFHNSLWSYNNQHVYKNPIYKKNMSKDMKRLTDNTKQSLEKVLFKAAFSAKVEIKLYGLSKLTLSK